MKIEAAVVALTVTALEMFASVVAVAMANSDGDGSQNRVMTRCRAAKRVVAIATRAMAMRVVGERRRQQQH